jgi:hypothetical protein
VLRAWAPWHLLRQFWYDGAADHERVLPLACGDGGVIVVQVLDLPPSARSATAVRLGIANGQLDLPTALVQGACDGQGVCMFTGLVDFDWEVTLASREFSFVPRVRQMKLATLPANPWFTTQRRGTVLLRGVLRRTDGPALAGVRIARDTRGETFAADESAVTDRGGAFCIATSLLAGEPFVLRLADREWVLKQDKRPPQRGYLQRAYASCYEGVADARNELRLEAERGAAVRARIVDADGVPVALERAELQDDLPGRGWYEIAEGATEPDGTVAFPIISPIADELRVRVACPRGFAVSAPFRLASPGQRVIELRLQPAGAIEGTVSGPDGAPLPGACVVLQDVLKVRNQTLVTPVDKVLADRRGRFRFVAVPPGPHQLALVARNGSLITLADVDVAPGAAVTQHCLAR